jgi:tetratricopeptide (TPR) repeat protein
MDVGTTNSSTTATAPSGTTPAAYATNLKALSAGLLTSAVTDTSLFGPDTLVSIGGGIPAFTGFTDYTNLGTSGVWQFDLAGVLNTQSAAAVPTMAVSEKQQEAENAAIKQAFDLIDQGQYTSARQLMNDLLSENKTNAAALQALGYVEQGEKNYAKAERLFLQANAFAPDVGYDQDAANARLLQKNDATVYNQASAMVKTSTRRADGLRLLIALTERSPDFTAAHLTLGDALLDTGDGTNGLMQYNTAVQTAAQTELGEVERRLVALAESAPSAPFVQSLLGKVQLRQERYDAALQSLNKAASLSQSAAAYSPDLARAYVGIGRARLAQGDLAGALESLTTARTYSPTGAEVKTALAEAYVERAERNAAAHSYSAALADYSRIASLLNGAGNDALRKQAAASAYSTGLQVQRSRIAAGGEIDAELLAFQAAHDLAKDNLTYKRTLATDRVALGDQHAAAGELEEAAGSYQAAHELFKYDATYRQKALAAWTAFGDEQMAATDYTDAVRAYSAAYKLDTTNTASRQKLADSYTARGQDYVYFKQWTQAVADFKNALQLFPDNATYQANYNSVSGWDTSSGE